MSTATRESSSRGLHTNLALTVKASSGTSPYRLWLSPSPFYCELILCSIVSGPVRSHLHLVEARSPECYGGRSLDELLPVRGGPEANIKASITSDESARAYSRNARLGCASVENLVQSIYWPSVVYQYWGTCCFSKHFRYTHFGTVEALFSHAAGNLYCDLPIHHRRNPVKFLLLTMRLSSSARYAVCGGSAKTPHGGAVTWRSIESPSSPHQSD